MPDLSMGMVDYRRAFLESPEAHIFIQSLTPKILNKFKACYLTSDFNSRNSQEVLSYLVRNSSILSGIRKDNTSALPFEYFYQKKPAAGRADAYFHKGSALHAIYQRLRALKLNLPEIIRKECESRNRRAYKIVNIGSGPSHEMIEIILENPDLKDKIHVTCVDSDREALVIGAQRVAKLNLEKNFSFVPTRYQTFEGTDHDMILLIGIFCSSNVPYCAKVLADVKKHLAPKAIAVFSTIQKIMGEKDPLTDYIIRLSGWDIDYKSDHEPYEIAIAANFDPIGRFFDECGYNCMTVARMK